MTTQHTPTPFCTMYEATTVRGFDGTDVAINVKPDDCRFIVRACNAHDELVTMLRESARAMQAACAHMLAEIPEGDCVPPALTELEIAEQCARAALAKVAS